MFELYQNLAPYKLRKHFPYLTMFKGYPTLTGCVASFSLQKTIQEVKDPEYIKCDALCIYCLCICICYLYLNNIFMHIHILAYCWVYAVNGNINTFWCLLVQKKKKLGHQLMFKGKSES